MLTLLSRQLIHQCKKLLTQAGCKNILHDLRICTKKDRQMHRHTLRRTVDTENTETQTHTQTDTDTDRHTHTYRQTHTHTHIHTLNRHTHTEKDTDTDTYSMSIKCHHTVQ